MVLPLASSADFCDIVNINLNANVMNTRVNLTFYCKGRQSQLLRGIINFVINCLPIERACH
jgi:hypothetical protein